MNVTIVVKGDKEVAAKMRRLGVSLNDHRKALNDVSKQAIQYYQNQGFQGVFGPWAPLNPVYAAQKAQKWRGRGILVASGRMQDSFYADVTKTYAVIGNKANQFKYHQSTLPRTKMPRRATMGINEPIKRMIRQAFQQEMRDKIRTV